MNIAKQYRKMAATGEHFRGLSILQHVDQIGELVERHHSTRLLDYGCGAGDQYRAPHNVHDRWHVPRPALFDPAFRHDKPPRSTYQGVICTDVLEHLPSDQVQALLRRLLMLAEDWVFASVCCRLARKTFPNSEKNLHLTVEPLAWWEAQLREAIIWRNDAVGRVAQFTLVETP